MYDHKEIEKQIYEYWKKHKIYDKLKKKNAKGNAFSFLQGPPYTSGRIHIGTAWNNCLKDMIIRFKRLRGYDVWDRGGYDTHGLPIANKVQKELKIKDKEGIEKYGVDKFVKKCEEFAKQGAQTMSDQLRKLGVWMDNEDPYVTLSNEYIEGEWFFIKQAWDQKRIYRDKKIIHWCYDCETGLAKHELEYKNVKENSIFLKLKLKEKDNEYLVIWTTTPWTIPFNLAVMVNPKLEYVKVKSEDGEVYIIAKALADVLMTSVLGKKYKILETFKGDTLKGLEYKAPFHKDLKKVYDDLKKNSKNIHAVILSEKYVDTSAGSGLVHCAPGCGPEDKEVGDEYGIPAFNRLNETGTFQDMEKFTGMVAKKDDKKFVKMLEENSSLLAITKAEHDYPHCWRCREPVVFRATEQWFLKIKDLVPKMIKENSKVNWVPKFGKTNYDKWTENLRDNSIVRQRYWGCPFPLWKCDKCGEIEVIGDIKELKQRAGKIPTNLHKPWIDNVKWKCKKCKGKMIRDPDILDVWIDAGTAGWNCFRYLKNKKDFEKFFPADLILEATEQVRLWFSMLNICSTIALKKQSYKACYMHGMVMDFQGTKMSKSLGNIIGPEEVIEKAGADGLRYYMFQNSAGENFNFSWNELKVKQRNLNVLSNISNFILDLRKQTKAINKQDVEEKYILSRKNSTIEKVTKLMDGYRLDEIIKEIENLFLDLSRVYIKFTRDKSNSQDAGKVLSTLEEVYKDVLIMFSIVSPFISDHLYQKTFGEKESVHLCDWPNFDKKKINEKLEQEFDQVRQIIEKGLAERDKNQIGLKWPLSKATMLLDKKLGENVVEIIKNQLNVKQIEFRSPASKGTELVVELDTKLTPELEAEGYARQISRQVQAFRKELGLEKKDKIELHIQTDKKFEEILEKNISFIKDRTNSIKLTISDDKSKKCKKEKSFKIKEKSGTIWIC